MLGPASTDAVNRAPSTNYSEVTGITQTVRNFGASLGLAVLGAILIERDKTNIAQALRARGVPAARAEHIASQVGSTSSGGAVSGHSAADHAIRLATAHATGTVFHVMAGVMAACFVLTFLLYPRGRAREHAELSAGEAEAAAPLPG